MSLDMSEHITSLRATALDRLLSDAQVRDLTGLSRALRRRLAAAGKFPGHVKVSHKVCAYIEADIREWLEGQREAARRRCAQSALRADFIRDGISGAKRN